MRLRMTIDLYRQFDRLDLSKYIIASYWIESKTTIKEALNALAIGQSIGNPNIRSKLETDHLVEDHAAKILTDVSQIDFINSTVVQIAYPINNINIETDGISQLLCMTMGGQMDIDIIQKCHLESISFPPDYEYKHEQKPIYGISGLREKTGMYERPLLGCIIKPKIGLKPKELAGIVKEMIDGGANIIKEDEILANPLSCPLEERLPYIADLIQNKPVVYLACINGDADIVLEKAKTVHRLGVNGVHLNIWSGIGTYSAIRRLNLPLAIHYQKSGDKVMTDPFNHYKISWSVFCDLAAFSGVDTIHVGMWNGYSNDREDLLEFRMKELQKKNVLPALSCGMTARLIPYVTEKFGYEYLANVGGAVHAHKDGIKAAVKELRDSIDGKLCF